jgi:hypothetical protein
MPNDKFTRRAVRHRRQPRAPRDGRTAAIWSAPAAAAGADMRAERRQRGAAAPPADGALNILFPLFPSVWPSLEGAHCTVQMTLVLVCALPCCALFTAIAATYGCYAVQRASSQGAQICAALRATLWAQQL